jgi:hypothetical protein
MYGACVVACVLALIDTDYSDLSALNIAAVAAVLIALVSVAVNIITERRK